MAAEKARRGWRERIEPGIYRTHRLVCPRSGDRRPGGRCACPLQVQGPGERPGTSRTVTLAEGATLREARNAHRRLRAEGRPAAPGPVVEPGTLDEFARSYFRAKAPTLAPSTVKARDEAYRLRIGPHLGHLDLADLTRERVEVWLAELVATSSAHAVWKAAGALRAILKAAVEWGRITANPAAGLRLPKPAPETARAVERVLDEGQLQALFAATREARVETMLRAAGEAGLRLGEVLGLRWPDVDLAARRLAVERAVWQEAGRGGAPRRIVKGPKGGRSRRVAISATFAAGWATGTPRPWWSAERRQTATSGPAATAGPRTPARLGRRSPRVLVRAGLVGGDGRPLVSFHGLRHTAASIMLARGVPLIVVSRQLGHANPNITAQVYAHLLSDTQLDGAAAVFEVPAGTGTMRETMREVDAEP